MFFIFILPFSVSLFLHRKYRLGKLNPSYIVVVVAVGLSSRLALAPITSHPFDTVILSTSARGWFGAGVTGASLGPTLPLTFVAYWVPYSIYALMLRTGFHDFYVLGHQVGFFETAFIKGFPIISDLLIFYFLLKFNTQQAGRLLASFYLLNPLAIYVSAVWGQYEASAALFIVIGFLFLSRQGVGQELKASLAFVAASVVGLFGLIPLGFLLIRRAVSRPFKTLDLALLASPLALLAVYFLAFSQTNTISEIFASVIGASSPVSVAQPSAYTIVSKFPQIAPFHPLIALLSVLTIVFVVRRKYDLQNIILFTIFAFMIFLFFGWQQPQYWVVILPLGLTYALVSKNFAVGHYMLTLGSFVAFLTLSYTQGSGFMLLGDARLNLFPALENVPRGIYLYTIPTAIGALGMFGYLFTRNRVIAKYPIMLSVLFLIGTFVLSYLLTR